MDKLVPVKTVAFALEALTKIPFSVFLLLRTVSWTGQLASGWVRASPDGSFWHCPPPRRLLQIYQSCDQTSRFPDSPETGCLYAQERGRCLRSLRTACLARATGAPYSTWNLKTTAWWEPESWPHMESSGELWKIPASRSYRRPDKNSIGMCSQISRWFLGRCINSILIVTLRYRICF